MLPRRVLLIAILTALVCVGGIATARLSLQWESIGPEGGRIDGLVQSRTNPDRMYALLHEQGVHRSDDRGENWNRVDTGLPLDAIDVAVAVSSADQNVVLVAPATGDSLLRSTDAGVTWNAYAVAVGLGEVRDIEFDPFDANHLLLTVKGGAAPGIFRSVDGGTNWSPANAGFTSTNPWQIEYHPSTPGTVLVAADGGVFRSTNGGVSWIASNMNGHGTIGAVSYCRNSPSTVWSADLTPNRILRSTDGGASFSNIGNVFCGGWDCNLSNVVADISDPASILGGFKTFDCSPTEGCFSSADIRRSTNSGVSWGAPYAPNAWIHGSQVFSSLIFDAALTELVYCSIGNAYSGEFSVGMARSTDSGDNWAPWMGGLHGLSISRVRADGAGRIYAMGSETNALWRSEDAGDSWIALNPAAPYEVLAFEVNRGNPEVLHIAGGHWDFDVFDPQFRRSTNFGASWVSTNLPDVGIIDVPDCVASDPLSAQSIYLWCSFGPGNLYRSTDGGESFDVLEEVGTATAAVVSATDPMRVYAIRPDTPGTVQYTTDGGVVWNDWAAGLPTGFGAASLFVDPPEPYLSTGGSLVVVYRTVGAFRSKGLGANWTPIPLPGYQGQVVIDSDYDPDTDRLFLCTENGDIFTSDQGFISQELTAVNSRTVTFEKQSQSLFVGTSLTSVFRLNLEDVVEAPLVVSPSPPFCSITATPSPSRGIARLSMTLSRDVARARIAIVDVRGRRVAALFDGAIPQGSHDFSWDARLDGGSRAASGIYFVKLEADGQVASTRIILVRD